MDELYQTYTKRPKQDDKESANRTLKKLRILLILWLVSFVLVLVWSSF